MKIKNAYYLIVDVEATCSNDHSVPRQHMEIIEIGALLFHAPTLQVESEFQTFIQPIRHPNLTPFCMALTSITQADVDAAPRFPDALTSFRAWYSSYEDYLFSSWGEYDKHQFRQDCTFHDVAYPFPGEHLNLKKAFSAAIGAKKRYGMGAALRWLGTPLEGTHHRALDDARNIARIVREVLDRA